MYYIYPESMLSKVLLPAPDGPAMAFSSPERKWPDSPSSMSLFSVKNKINNDKSIESTIHLN